MLGSTTGARALVGVARLSRDEDLDLFPPPLLAAPTEGLGEGSLGPWRSPAALSAEAVRMPPPGEGARPPPACLRAFGVPVPAGLPPGYLFVLSRVADHGLPAALDPGARRYPCWLEEKLDERGRTLRSGIGRTDSGSISREGGNLAARACPAPPEGTRGPVAAVSLFAVQGTADWCSKRCSKPTFNSSVAYMKPPPTRADIVRAFLRSISFTASLSMIRLFFLVSDDSNNLWVHFHSSRHESSFCFSSRCMTSMIRI